MNVTLKQLIPALVTLGVDTKNVEQAIEELRELLAMLDQVEVKGRQAVDILLGCMMATEGIIGKDGDEVNG